MDIQELTKKLKTGFPNGLFVWYDADRNTLSNLNGVVFLKLNIEELSKGLHFSIFFNLEDNDEVCVEILRNNLTLVSFHTTDSPNAIMSIWRQSASYNEIIETELETLVMRILDLI